MLRECPECKKMISDRCFSCPNCGLPDPFVCPDLVLKRYYGGDYCVWKYCGDDKTVEIPSYYRGRYVTFIGAGAFSECTSLTSIIIPDSVKTIEISAFSKCTSLKSIIIPNSATDIRPNTFWGCTSLVSITLPEKIKTIGVWFCKDCTSLTSIIIPDSVTRIDGGAFEGCSRLSDIRYNGTIAEWRKIEKSHRPFDYGKTVHCLDGDCPADL